MQSSTEGGGGACSRSVFFDACRVLNRVQRAPLRLAGITRFSLRVIVGESTWRACRPLSSGAAADTAASTVSRFGDSFARCFKLFRKRWLACNNRAQFLADLDGIAYFLVFHSPITPRMMIVIRINGFVRFSLLQQLELLQLNLFRAF